MFYNIRYIQYPWDIVGKAQELGLINAHVPEEYGGLGLGCTEGCMINEEVAYGCSGIGTALEANSLGVSCGKYILILRT